MINKPINEKIEEKLKEIDFKNIIELIKNGKQLPQEYQYLLFPINHNEYKLQYFSKMRYEDILANEDGVQSVPLQLENTFKSDNKWHDWNNMLFFGDNLQLLKTIYANKDPLIKDKVKGKVKLIYIDPPFATQDEFKTKSGIKAYSDKKKGSEFIEFIRRRLILAKEILADDGSIFVHLDSKMSHYIKIIMDEIFGKNNLINEIIWAYTGPGSPNIKQFNRKHDVIFWYSKSNTWTFNRDDIRVPYKDPNQTFRKAFDSGEGWDEKDIEELRNKGKVPEDWWEFAIAARQKIDGVNRTGYPTEKPEELLERIIKSASNEGDIILDFFGGGGTTSIVAEKLNRKWITCDIGKYSCLTIQKRLLEVHSGKKLNQKIEVDKFSALNEIEIKFGKKDKYELKDFLDIEKLKNVYGKDLNLENLKIKIGTEKKSTNEKYGIKHKQFIMAQLGLYDLDKIFNMDFESYKEFCSHLFNFKLREKTVNGISIDGQKDGNFVEIFDYKKYLGKDVKIDLMYIKTIHSELKDYIKERYYIISPSNFVAFKEDFYVLDGIKYYFLRIPYHMINELHKEPFVRTENAQSKDKVNEINYAVGFHFKISPEVIRVIEKKENTIKIKIKSFISLENNPNKNHDFNRLSSIFIDNNYEENFNLCEVIFKKDVKLNKNDEFEFELKNFGDKIFIIYSDVCGNEFKEIINVGEINNG